ncbi:MAG: SDR family NAD(P)-dependent oxidoreductase [Acidimicrobiales bacterium]
MATPRWTRALVTGASSGIGAAFARRLAAGRTDLVLVARRGDRLTAMAAELEVDVEVVPADLSRPDQRRSVEARLSGDERPIDLLVNSAGIGMVGSFHEVDADELESQIELNVVAVVRVTHAGFTAMRRRGKGAIVVVSSLAALQPLPKHAVYAATKAFVTSLSDALVEEARGTGVSITNVMPGFVDTEFVGRAATDEQTQRLPGFLWMSADAVAAAGLAAAAKGDPNCVPGLGYKAFAVATAPAPRWLKRWGAGVATRAF